MKRHQEMLADPELDAVSVCTPNKFHMQPTIDALEAGKHVIVEKPMGRNADECRRMLDAAKANGRHLVVGFQWRFNEQARFCKAQVDSGTIGRVQHVRVRAMRRRNVPGWGVFGNKDLQGGGAMIDMGVHLLEMAHHMIGSPQPLTVSATCRLEICNRPNDVHAPWGDWDHETWQTEDLAVAFLRFANDITMSLESSFAAHIEEPDHNVEILGTDGGCRYAPPAVFTNQNGYMVNTVPHWMPKSDAFGEKMRHFVEVCRDGRANQASGEDGLKVQQILDGIYASAEAGREVTLTAG